LGDSKKSPEFEGRKNFAETKNAPRKRSLKNHLKTHAVLPGKKE